LPERPSAKEMVALAEMWRPLRAVAARVLWTYYRAVKGRDGAPIAPSPIAPSQNPPSPASVVAQALPKLSPKPARNKQERIKKARSKRGGNGRRI